MKLFRVACLFLAASLSAPAVAGASGYWVAPPAYNAHYCPSATSVEPGGTVTLNARANSCTSGKPAEDLDTYKDLNGNKMTPPGGPDEERDSLQIQWTITGPDGYVETFGDFTWEWCAPSTPGTYTVKWRLTDGRDDGDPRRDGPVFTVLGTITVTALTALNITVPAGPGEYVNDVARIKVYIDPNKVVPPLSVYIDAVDGNHFKGYMALQTEGYYLFHWDTEYTAEGTHTIYVRASNAHGCAIEDSEVVFVHPAIQVNEIAFEQDHVLYDRVSDALVSRPQWATLASGVSIDKPIAYTRNSQMLVRPKLTTTNVTASVYLKYVATLSWDDYTNYVVEKTSSGVVFPYNQLPYYPTARGTVKQYGASQSIIVSIRRYQDSDWCPVGSTEAAHTQIYHTLQDPSSPWGANQHVWTEVLHEACNWANGQATATGVLTEITKGLHSRISHKYKYNRGKSSFSPVFPGSPGIETQTIRLYRFLDTANTIQGQGDCKDFSNYLCLLANSVGIQLVARRTSNPPSGRFFTKYYYPAGLTDYDDDEFTFHQYGLYNNVFDAAIRNTLNGDPPVNVQEYPAYKDILINRYTGSGFGVWMVHDGQRPAIDKGKYPRLDEAVVGLPVWVAGLTTSSAEIRWKTDVPSTSQVVWDTSSWPNGPISSYAYQTTETSQFPMKGIGGEDHFKTLGGLVENTVYYFRVISSGKYSEEYTFRTLPEA